MDLPEFLRAFPLRGHRIMWLLGAGASAAAGVPTAGQMTWDFKRQLYCSAQRRDVATCSDLGATAVRRTIQDFLDSAGGNPPEGTPDEYSHYFEAAYPEEVDRRQYLETQLSRSTPSFGHRVLAALVVMERTHVVWTPNFDKLIEDAVAVLSGTTSRLRVATIDSAAVAEESLQEQAFPLLVKFHGDFHSRRLKNTAEELRMQDARLRRALVAACRAHGLAVVGYSGRDASVMDALEEALPGGFPAGLLWFHRSDDPPSDRVSRLIDKAKALGIDAATLEIETFDELMADVVGMIADVPAELRQQLEQHGSRVVPARLPSTKGHWPVLRLNALPVHSWPENCRLVECGIGGAREVRQAIVDSGAAVIAARRKAGVIAFGADGELRRAFEPFGIRRMDLFPLERRRLAYDSTELGLLYEALCIALARARPLRVERRGRERAIVVANERDSSLRVLTNATRPLCGTVGGTTLRWAEAVELRMEFRMRQLWLLVRPTVWVDRPTDDTPDARGARKEFIRAQLATRYNARSNDLIDAWAKVLTGGADVARLSAFGVDAVDATFELGGVTAFSWRGGTS